MRNKQFGIKVPENTDTAMYRSSLIYEATVPEDREKVWNNKDAWKALDVISGYSMTMDEVAKKLIEAGGKATLLHHIVQRTGMSPDDVMAKPSGIRFFLLMSMLVQLEAESKAGGQGI